MGNLRLFQCIRVSQPLLTGHTMNRNASDHPCRRQPRPLGGLLARGVLLVALLPAAAQADPWLLAQDYLGALIGGPTGGYNQQLLPAYAPTVLSLTDSKESTQGSPYNSNWAPISARASGGSDVTFGLISTWTSAAASGYGSYVAAAEGDRSGYAFDVITVHGSGPITVTLHTELIGSSSADTSPGVDGGVAVRANTYLGPAGFVDNTKQIYLPEARLGSQLFDSTQSGSITVADGESFYVIATVTQNNTIQLSGAADILGTRVVTAGTRALYADWISLNPGASLDSQSGWNYRAPSAVPEPSAPLLALTGLGVLAGWLRARKR